MHKILVICVLSIVLSINACTDVKPSQSTNINSENEPGNTEGAPAKSPQNKILTVYAAVSLVDAFQEIGTQFQAENAEVQIDFNFAGSQILQTQIEEGANADVFASADQNTMYKLISENLVLTGTISVFATNQMVVILPPSNPAKIESLHDLSRRNIKLVLADSSVPAGYYARQVLNSLSQNVDYGENFSSKVLANVVSNETDVRQVVTKVELGEADAGFVYSSDVVARPGLVTIVIPDQYNVRVTYPIAILANSPNTDLASAFITYLESPTGQAVLHKWGFSQGQ